ncbi:MAG: hypothetical protein JST82_07040 [Bacteroidetes bacterium]|nr:hypothetical protein [Bacteroidota bacterium]
MKSAILILALLCLMSTCFAQDEEFNFTHEDSIAIKTIRNIAYKQQAIKYYFSDIAIDGYVEVCNPRLAKDNTTLFMEYRVIQSEYFVYHWVFKYNRKEQKYSVLDILSDRDKKSSSECYNELNISAKEYKITDWEDQLNKANK